MKNFLLIPLFLALATKCSDGPEQGDLPNLSILNEQGFQADSLNILYQFYEEYGFTDIGTHERVLIKKEDLTPERLIEKGFQKLPINQQDLDKANSIEGKGDDLYLPTLLVNYPYWKSFSHDIRNIFGEYNAIPDSVYKIDLSEGGYYKITDTSILIYESQRQLLYTEVQRTFWEN